MSANARTQTCGVDGMMTPPGGPRLPVPYRPRGRETDGEAVLDPSDVVVEGTPLPGRARIHREAVPSSSHRLPDRLLRARGDLRPDLVLLGFLGPEGARLL